MIRLTLMNEEYWYVNPDHIVSVKKGYKSGSIVSSDHQTGIEHTIDVTQVQESPEEVTRKVLEWRLAMERYRAAYAEVIRNSTLAGPDLEEAEHDMLKLAGLEE